MGREDKIRQVAELLKQTDSAHHSYEVKVLNGDRNSRWPEWYADNLIGHGFDIVLEDRLATELLENFLRRRHPQLPARQSVQCLVHLHFPIDG